MNLILWLLSAIGLGTAVSWLSRQIDKLGLPDMASPKEIAAKLLDKFGANTLADKLGVAQPTTDTVAPIPTATAAPVAPAAAQPTPPAAQIHDTASVMGAWDYIVLGFYLAVIAVVLYVVFTIVMRIKGQLAANRDAREAREEAAAEREVASLERETRRVKATGERRDAEVLYGTRPIDEEPGVERDIA